MEDKERIWDCHHCLGLVYTKEELIKRGLYYNQPAEMLMFVTRSEHKILHFITKKSPLKGTSLSEETKKKMSDARKGKKRKPEHIRRGWHHSDETKKKMSNSQTGRIITQEAREKLSISLTGKLVGEKNGMFGKHHSEHTKSLIAKRAQRNCVFVDENGVEHIINRANAKRWHPNWKFSRFFDEV